MDDRRTSLRIPLDVPCLLTLVLDGERCPAMLIDISAGGVHLALSPGPGGDKLLVHTTTVFKDVPGGLGSVLEGRTGLVAWVADRHCGIRLDDAISLSVDEIMALAPL